MTPESSTAGECPAILESLRPLPGQERLFHCVVRGLEDAPLPGFQAGQHARLFFTAGGEELSQILSIASGPGNPTWDFLVADPGSDGPTRAFLALPDGAHLRVDRPQGTFTLDRIRQPHVALVAGGAGLAPLRSMLLEFLARGQAGEPGPRSIVLWHGARTPEELAFRREFEEMEGRAPFPFAYRPCISQTELSGAEGANPERVDLALAADLGMIGEPPKDSSLEALLPAGNTAIVLCGPPEMVDSIIAMAEGSLWEASLVYEKWW